MTRRSYTLEIITPCFCAGGDQGIAEIRPASIRGQLRWWFRVLGGTAETEREVFGGIAGSASASRVTIRVSSQRLLHNWHLPTVSPNDPASYVWYFASVSGKETGAGARATGPRWKSAGVLAPKSTFKLEILQRQILWPENQTRFDLAIRCFLELGSMGLRISRGLGAFVCHEHPFSDSIFTDLQNAGFRTELRPESFRDLNDVVKTIGSLVKGTRKAKGWKVDSMSARPVSTPSPFGTSDPRQTSAVYFRPIRKDPRTDSFQLVVFEAPQQRVLAPQSRKPTAVGHNPSQLVVPPPLQRQNRR